MVLLIVATIAVASVLISGVLGWWFSHSPRQIIDHIEKPISESSFTPSYAIVTF